MTDRDKLVEVLSWVLADIAYSQRELLNTLKNKGVISAAEHSRLSNLPIDENFIELADSYKELFATLLAEEKPPEGGDKSFTDSKA